MIWKKIPSLNNRYMVSDTGIVKSLITNKILKLQINKGGYYITTFRPSKNKILTRTIHTLVAECFLGERPKGYVINHKDGNKKNNNASNLEYTTYSGNLIHAYNTGLHKKMDMDIVIKRGENNHMSVLTENEVIKILKLHYRTGKGCRVIARELNLPLGAVQGVLSPTRPRWKHIDREAIKQQVLKENGG